MLRAFWGAVSAAIVFGSSSAHAAIATFECTPGGSGTHTLWAPANDMDAVELTIAAGAKVNVTATLSDPLESGSLSLSPGGTVLAFPSATGVISGPLSATNLMLQTIDGAVTVTLACDTGDGATASTSSSAWVARNQTHQNLVNLVTQYSNGYWMHTYGTQLYDESAGYIDDFRDLDLSVAERDELLETAIGNYYLEYLRYKAGLEKSLRRTDLTPQQRAEMTRELEGATRDLDTIRADWEQARRYNAALGYGVAGGQSTSALRAIDTAAGVADPVSATFNVLGYGPTGGFEGSALLAEGDRWKLVASGVGAISQTDSAAGGGSSVSGRGTINLITSPARNLGIGVALSLGATSETGGSIEDRANHYAADLVASYRLGRNLVATGSLGYELTDHDFTRAGATGSGLSHLTTAALGLSGDYRMPDFTLTPSLDVAFTHESQAAVTLSDATNVEGFRRTSGKVTIGGQISHTYDVEGAASVMAVTPRLGLDGSVSLSQTRNDAGTQTASTTLGIGVTAGIDVELESGLDLGLKSRISRSGGTTGASLTGSISASF